MDYNTRRHVANHPAEIQRRVFGEVQRDTEEVYQDQLRIALEHYEEFHEFLKGDSATVEILHSSSVCIACGLNTIQRGQFESAIRFIQRGFAGCG